jgi:hypothetical protein
MAAVGVMITKRFSSLQTAYLFHTALTGMRQIKGERNGRGSSLLRSASHDVTGYVGSNLGGGGGASEPA